MLWVLIALSVGELCLVHLLVALLWSRSAALVLSLVTIAGIFWLIAAIRSFRTLPVLLDETRILLRAGRIRSIVVERSAIAGLRTDITAVEANMRDVLKLSLLAHPNVVIDLREPIAAGRRRRVRAIAHRLDDPAAFVAALRGAVSLSPAGPST